MSTTHVTVSLVDSAKPGKEPMDVDATGIVIRLDVPPDVELESAAMTLLAPDDDVALDVIGGPPAASVATSIPQTRGLQSEPVKWISADWGVRRRLLSIQVGVEDESKGDQGKLLVSEGGPWFPPMPLDALTLGRPHALSGVTASRAMVRMVDGDGAPSTDVITALSIQAAAQPVDLRAAVDADAPFFEHPLPLAANEIITLRDDLAAALRRAWPPDLEGGAIDITLRSSAPGKLLWPPSLSLRSSVIARTWAGGAREARLSLPGASEVEASAPLATQAPLEAVRFTIASQLRRERLSLSPSPPAAPALAHRCGAGFVAAQSFAPLPAGARISGVEVYLRSLSRALRGTIAVHADELGRPAASPLPGATLKLDRTEPADPPWPSRWIALDLPEPLSPGAGAWWVVVTLDEGDALWPLGDAATLSPAPEVEPRAGANRLGMGPFRLRERLDEAPSWTAPWAFARVRLFDPAPPAPVVTLRWGTSSLAVTPDAAGRVSLDRAALAPLSPPDGPAPLRVAVQSAVGGEVTLSDLWVAFAPEDADAPDFT